MIKAIATRGTRKVLVLGLSAGNIEKLADDQPIHFNVEQMGLTDMHVHEVVIFAGETEELMRADLEKYGAVGPDTVIHEEPRRQ